MSYHAINKGIDALIDSWRVTNYGHFGPGHFATSLVGPNCPDRSVLVPKCPKYSSDLSAELSRPKCRSVLARF